MKTQKGNTIIVVLIGALVLLIAMYAFRNINRAPEAPVIEPNQQAFNLLDSNNAIKGAMESFRQTIASREASGTQGAFCTGGFLNDSQSELRDISNTIIDNRIINSSPLEYATTQDEAGITCLVVEDDWVLFSPLNPHPTNDRKDYWCVDSDGATGSFGFDTGSAQCMVPESI